LPIRQNRVLLYVNQRKGFTCNPKYIANEFLRRYGNRIELIWVTEYPDTCSSVKKRGIRVVGANSWQHWYYQLTAKAIVVNDAFHESVILRSKQVTMNTWHAAMNYKRIGLQYLNYRNRMHQKTLAIRNIQPDIYISGSRFFTEDTSRSFGFEPSVFAEIGSPRNDIFFQDVSGIRESICKRYQLENDLKLVLYAPTFRNDCCNRSFELDFERLRKNLTKRFGGDWRILYRRHYFIHADRDVCSPHVIDVSDYEDMNELLAVSDVLISDYSSCLWDFSLTKRPSFVYATDVQNYREEDRSFAYPMEKWPYPIAANNDELESRLIEFDDCKYAKRILEHQRDAVMFDDGNASGHAVELLAEAMGLGKE